MPEDRPTARWVSHAVLIVGLLAVGGHYALPGDAQAWVYNLFAVACAAAVGYRARQTGRGRLVWVLFAAGVLLWVTADIAIQLAAASNNGVEPFPSVIDVLYLAGYPTIAAAIVVASRERGQARGIGTSIEGLIVTVAAGVPVWVFIVGPVLADSTVGALPAVVGATYPLMDLLLLGVAVRLTFAGSGRNPSASRLLGAGLAANLIADVVYSVQTLHGTLEASVAVTALWMASYVFWAAAAVHPSAAAVLEPVEVREGAGARKRIAVVLAVAALLLPTIGVAYVQGTEVEGPLVLAALAAITLLIGVRLRQLAVAGVSSQWRGIAVLFSAVFVAIVLSVGLTSIRAGAERRLQATQELLRARSQVERAERFAATMRTSLAARVLSEVDAPAVARELGSYARAVGRKTDRAASRGALTTALTDEIDRTDAEATSRARAGRLFTVLMLALATILLGLVSVRFGAARRAYEREQERRRVTEDSEEGFRALVSGSADMITVIGADTTVLSHPESVERVLGLEPNTILGTPFDAHLQPDDVARTHAVLAVLADHPGEARSLEWCLVRADGSAMNVEVSLTNHLDDPHLAGFVVNVRDVSDRKRLEEALQHQAFHDHLTGLANRALMEDRLRLALERSAREPSVQALLCLDLDDFKLVNDSLGHPVGDELLVEVSQRLQQALRTADTLARMGGDEFAILLEGLATVEEATATARRLLGVLREPVSLPGGQFVVGVSIGMAASFGGAEDTVEEEAARLLRNADLAMYEAKRLGGGQVEVFAPEMHDAVSQRLQLKSELQRGLDRREFVVHYQPIVEIDGGETVGFEALVRWQHPERGLVGPNAFIEAAEQTGLIVELGDQVLRAACRQAAQWNASLGVERHVSVNVAGGQLAREDFVEEVRDALREAGLPPRLLILEVTETALISDSDGNRRRMAGLRELGVRLAIDDFGTGYSSLNYLRQFSMDVLKIDKSFIDCVAVEGREQALVEAMIAMGRSLGLNVVAEGIEELAQADVLAGRSCALGQGFLYSRPLPAGEVEAYLRGPRVPADQCSSLTS